MTKTKRKTTIGGQALIEGIMMKGPHKISTAIRKPDGEITIRTKKLKSIFKKDIFNKPIIRGSLALIEAMLVGVKELMYSAEFYEDEIEEDFLDKALRKIFKDKADTAIIYASVALALLISIGVFILGPSLITNLLRNIVPVPILLNLIEGFIRIGLFVIYVYYISKLEDIKRVFMYHGAEHKTIYCYENMEELTVENARKYTTLHPRCGTSFIVNVLLISIVVFSFFGWPNPLMRIVIRLAMLPLIAGIAYEVNRYVGRNDETLFAKIAAKPGFLFQKLTTKEPDDSMLEVAIAALKEVIPENKDDDKW
ncbi:MAG: DUF1385 domain-containing protein [Bacillota bacterium]|nr:DUF1385 domain-containing protein [Bacillota bacterium]